MSNQQTQNIFRNVYFYVLFNSIKDKGFFWLVKKIFYKSLKELTWISLLPISMPLHLLGVRRLQIRVEHIGHLAAEPDAFIKEKMLGLRKDNIKFYFVLAPAQQLSNKHLINYWRPYITILQRPLICSFLSILSYRYFLRCDVSRYISSFVGTQDIYKIHKVWMNQSPLLTLKDEDRDWGEEKLSKLGINKKQWYVCLHVREGGFLPHNELIQSHRNGAVENTFLAIEEIIKRGGVVVRMGDKTMKPLPAMNNVIDYAHHPLKSDRLDVILCAKARFFLGCTSGLSFVSTIFGVPAALANMIPVAALGVSPNDISIPKLLWSEEKQRHLTFSEILSSDLGSYYFTHQYNKAKVKVEENSPEDILALTVEMLDRLEGKDKIDAEAERLHSQYLSLFKPGHYSYGAASKVCRAFLISHKNLLTE